MKDTVYDVLASSAMVALIACTALAVLSLIALPVTLIFWS